MYQFDLDAGSPADVLASGQIILDYGTLSGSNWRTGGLQMASDRKIYYGTFARTTLGVVNHTDSVGTACGYDPYGFDYPNGWYKSYYGLPNFPVKPLSLQSKPIPAFSAPSLVCGSDCISFENETLYATTRRWSFPGGNPAESTDLAPTVCYDAPGVYVVSLALSNALGSDTAFSTITVAAPPEVTIAQIGGNFLYSAVDYETFQWYKDTILISGCKFQLLQRHVRRRLFVGCH